MDIECEIKKLSPKEHDIIVISVPMGTTDNDRAIIEDELKNALGNKINVLICYSGIGLTILSDEQLKQIGLKRIKE